ncbi:hypothetical protein M1N62_04225 [Thermodesulfovibrionales bacterium]|nr:hypothetical protein [Thermodesulfovibrionales bacterium]
MLKEIGDYYGISESAVSQASRRFEMALPKKDREVRKKVKHICDRLNLCNV